MIRATGLIETQHQLFAELGFAPGFQSRTDQVGSSLTWRNRQLDCMTGCMDLAYIVYQLTASDVGDGAKYTALGYCLAEELI